MKSPVRRLVAKVAAARDRHIERHRATGFGGLKAHHTWKRELFGGDGEHRGEPPSRRYGVEFANDYRPTKWLTFDADFSWSHARFRDEDPAGRSVPGSIKTVVPPA